MKKYIYKITNTVNDKCYIGQSKNYRERFQGHRRQLKQNKHENPYLQHSWNKYGEENFTFEVLEYVENYNEREKYWIKKFNSTNRDYGYNILPGGEEPPVGAHSILSKENAKQIQDMLIAQQSVTSIHKQFNSVTRGQINKINTGQVWYDKNLQYPLKKNADYEIGNDVAELVMNDLLNTFISQKEIAKKYNISRTCVTAINQGDVNKYRNEFYQYPLRKSACKGSVCDDPKIVDSIINDLKSSPDSIPTIAKKYQIHESTVYRINKGGGRGFRENTIYPIRKVRNNKNIEKK